jgi:hypothetical protein
MQCRAEYCSHLVWLISVYKIGEKEMKEGEGREIEESYRWKLMLTPHATHVYKKSDA